MIKRIDVIEMIFGKKRAGGLTWDKIAEDIGMSEVFTTSVCLGMNALPRDKADMLVKNLGLPLEAAGLLAASPTKVFDPAVPTDPCIYRLYEVVGVYGGTIKELINEKFGNGIMSAVDFNMEIVKVPHPKGDRVELRMSGKYLPYSAW